MTKPVRYQEGYLYVHHEAWFVRYREPVRQPDGSIKFRQRAKKLGSVKDYPHKSQIEPLFAEFMRQQNAGNVLLGKPRDACGISRQVLSELHRGEMGFHKKGLRGNLEQLPHPRIASVTIRMREFRTVDASRMLKAIANENGSDQDNPATY